MTTSTIDIAGVRMRDLSHCVWKRQKKIKKFALENNY
jgi:hypothetical protein